MERYRRIGGRLAAGKTDALSNDPVGGRVVGWNMLRWKGILLERAAGNQLGAREYEKKVAGIRGPSGGELPICSWGQH